MPERFVVNTDGAVNLNTVHGLRRQSDFPMELIEIPVAWLNKNSDELGGGRTYAGGLQKVEPSEMAAFMVPSVKQLRSWGTKLVVKG